MRELFTDVAIIGGGASGLAAACSLGMKAPGLSVTLLEKMSEPGRKIRATGSGRCNITNTSADGYDEIMGFFSRIGLAVRIYDNGLVYPYSESAADVASLLTARACSLGTRIIADAEVTGVTASGGVNSGKGNAGGRASFEITYSSPKTSGGSGKRTECLLRAAYVILACGGKAGPMFGTTGDGYRIARELGHSIVTPVPVLTSIECREWEEGQEPCAIGLAGTRTRGTVSLYRLRDTLRRDTGRQDASSGGEEPLFRETGEIQFTKYGLSGICVFNMTRHMRYDRNRGESLSDFIVMADLYPDGDAEEFLRKRRDNAFQGELASDVLRTVLKENIAAYVLGSVPALNMDGRGKKVSELTDSDIRAIGNAVHRLAFHPERLRGWKEAQASSGGVSLDELGADTCESLIIPGLYITGELADRDYPCGGYNLSNAWITGMKSAASIASNAL